MARLTRFKGRDGKDGPVSGAIVVFPVVFTEGVASSTYDAQVSFPAGMSLELVAIRHVSDGAAGGDASLTVGTTSGGAEVVAAVDTTATVAQATLLTTAITGGNLFIRETTAVGETFDAITVTVVAYVSAPPDSLAVRHPGHF